MFSDLIPIVLFVCIAFAIKVVVDAGVRRHMISSGASDETLQALIRGEDHRRRRAALHWGIVLVALAAGFGVIQAAGWESLNAGLVAVLAAATGLGNLVFYAIARRGD